MALRPATFSAEHLKSAALSEGRAIVLWIAFVVIFHETLGWARFAPPAREASREDRFQLSGAEWTAEDDALLRSLIGSGKPPRAIALEMKRTVGGIRARTAKLGLRNNRPAKRPSIEAPAGRQNPGCFSLLTSAAQDGRCLVAYPGQGVYECAPMGPRGGVVTQRSAKPCTPVQFWSWPPSIQSMPYADYMRPQAGRDQQAAYQPSGNGTSGQGGPLSLAARGDG